MIASLQVDVSAAKLIVGVDIVMKKPVPQKPASGTVSASAFIDERIKQLGDWRGKTLAKVREIIHQADPKIVEERKWIKPTSPGTPVFSHDGIICTGETHKNVVKLTFARGAALKDQKGYSTPAWKEMSGARSIFTTATSSMRLH